MKENILESKSKQFSLKIIKLTDLLYENKNLVIANQLLRSGTSIGANISESTFASSRADFINKLQIAQKEANETKYWLYLLSESKKIDIQTYDDLLYDLNEIIKINSSSILTAKNNN